MFSKYALPLILVGCTLAVTSHAQTSYPNRTVRVVVPWPSGGSNDITARVVMKAVGEATGQAFVVDNRAGAGGTMGAEIVAKAPPDGYTLMIHSGTHVSNAFTYKSLPYDTLKDFVPVASMAAQSLGLVVPDSSPFRTLKDFLAAAKKDPGKLAVSSSGVGSAAHLQISLLQEVSGVSFLHVPYKGGGPQAQALLTGEMDAGVYALATVLPLAKAGKARVLAITSDTRSSTFPNVPTVGEVGLKGFDFTPWIALFAPAGTPLPIIEKLNAEIFKALQRDDVKQSLSANALDLLPLKQEEFARRVASDYRRYANISETAGKQIQQH